MSNSPEPLVSVGIPTYNQPDFLRQAIQSVLNQTFQDFEIVVVDDCSTDHTSSVVSQFSDPRVRYYRTEVNLRPPKSWNECVRRAKGKFFALLPHDDIHYPAFLQQMLAALERHPEAGFAQCAFCAIDVAGQALGQRRIGETEFFTKGENAMALQTRNYYCNPAAILFRKDQLVERGLWDVHYWDDVVLILAIAFHRGFVYVPQLLSAVRKHASNLSTELGRNEAYAMSNVIDQQTALFGKILPMTPGLLRQRNRMNRAVGYSCLFYSLKWLSRGNAVKAAMFLDKGICVYPSVLLDPRFYFLGAKRMLMSMVSKLPFTKRFIFLGSNGLLEKSN